MFDWIKQFHQNHRQSWHKMSLTKVLSFSLVLLSLGQSLAENNIDFISQRSPILPFDGFLTAMAKMKSGKNEAEKIWWLRIAFSNPYNLYADKSKVTKFYGSPTDQFNHLGVKNCTSAIWKYALLTLKDSLFPTFESGIATSSPQADQRVDSLKDYKSYDCENTISKTAKTFFYKILEFSQTDAEANSIAKRMIEMRILEHSVIGKSTLDHLK
jgi:hypothetical protein